MVEGLETESEKPGRVVVCEENPLRFLAVVHDLDQEPSWREDWIEKALEEVLREAERRKLQRIALPFLGTKHGSLEKKRFAALFRGFLKRRPSPYHLRVWLVLPPNPTLPINDWLAGD
jgi:O-acetyl-ADP-ribose deacetylase (regulator of RNase III)